MDFLDGADAFRATFSDDERAVSDAAFRGLLEGAPVAPSALIRALGVAPGRVTAAIARLVERGTMTLDAAGDVVAARGLSVERTPHALHLDGDPLYAFCAVDAIGIPLGLGRAAVVQSRCHACRAPVTLRIADGRVDAGGGVVIWAADRDVDRPLREHT